jgi:hypothetical protein
MQFTDSPLWLYRHPAQQLRVHIAHRWSSYAAGQVKAHAGDPLIEAANTLASDAAEFDPLQSQEVDPKGVHFRYRGTLVPCEKVKNGGEKKYIICALEY